ncbi:hypothetical protein [Bdellovibrio sp. HCB337]|uniref:hypothetical protein n=1 Tax=Bdellovibrio sp. HCB337 TaxID=3394358 RepID=UPI0039A51305
MKYGIVLLICGLLAACSNQNANEVTQEERVHVQTYSGLTKTAWCAERDEDKDGAIGTYKFKNNGSAEWIGYKPATKEIYGRKSFNWSLKEDLLQVDDEIGTFEGQKITFDKKGEALVRMKWTAVSQTLSENGKVTFVGVPCTLPAGSETPVQEQ